MPNERPFIDSAEVPAIVGKSDDAPRAAPRVEAPASRARARVSRGTPDKRERILRAAIKVFARKGFYATKVSEIAKAAGVADGTIYLYFENKDAVLISIFEDRIRRLIAVLRNEVAADLPWEERFRRVVELQLGLLEGQRDLAEVITINLRQSSRLMKQYAAPLFTEYLDVMASLVAEGQRSGRVRADVSPRIVARSLWGALDGVAVTWALGSAGARNAERSSSSVDAGGEPPHLRKAASQVANVFLEGLRRG